MKIAVAGLVVVTVALAAGLGGCADSKYVQVTNEVEFRQQVLDSPKPVLVDFYKGGCPTCGLVQPTLDKLQAEYQGRVVFAQFMIMQPYFAVTCEKIKDEYDLAMYPTVILFVNGKEQKRWSLEYDIGKYRPSIDSALADQMMPAATK